MDYREVFGLNGFEVHGVCPFVSSQKYHLTSKAKAIYVVIATLSIIAATFVFTTIFTVKKLRAHPSIMIGYISLFEAISCFHSVVWAVGTMEFIDYFGLEYLFKHTIMFGMTEGYDTPCNALCQLNQVLGYQFFQIMSLGMNLCLCVDLMLTLRQPFYPAKRRLKFYLLFSFCLALTMVGVSAHKAGQTCFAPSVSGDSKSQNSLLAFMLSCYILVSLFSIIYSARMLSRPGISSEIRSMFMKKHVMYAVSFIIIWSLILLNAYNVIYNPEINKSDPEYNLKMEQGYAQAYITGPLGIGMNVWVSEKNYMELNTIQIISFLASMSTGLVMGVIRCFEPYFHFLLLKTIKAFYGIPLSEEEIDKRKNKLTDTIATFLNSSLNIELVHIILKAISQECTKTELPVEGWKSFIPIDDHFKEKAKHNINEIVIKDPEKWNLIDQGVKKNKNTEFHETIQENGLIIREDISVKELAPKIFSIIRNRENITNEQIKQSLSPELNRDMVFKAGEGQGKSGSFFFFSHDRKFIIKTMNEDEYSTFQNIFRGYYEHINKHPDSLIARIYGVFTVNKEKLQPVHLILMGNTVNLNGNGKNLKLMFDLKGSLVNRESKMEKNHKPSSTLKDINLLEIKKNENILKFNLADSQSIINTIRKDVPVLKEGNIMDYSLLLAIEENPNYRSHASTLRKLSSRSPSNSDVISRSDSDLSGNNKDGPSPINFSSKNNDQELQMPHKIFEKSRHMFLSSNLQYIYHLAIIDYLQDYNFDKKGENFVKKILRGRKAEISAVPPEPYSKRFIEFMEGQVIIPDKKQVSNSSDKDMDKIDEEDEDSNAVMKW